MLRAMRTAASGMAAQQLLVDTISNNLANINTTGYKKARARFEDLLYQTTRPAGLPSGSGTATPMATQVGYGSRITGTEKLFSQGDSEVTGNALDIAIGGDGFLQFLSPSSEIVYSRDGALRLDSEGRLVSGAGYPLEPAITFPQETMSVYISPEGEVQATVSGGSEPQVVGRIELARFVNEAGLESTGGNLLKKTAASGDPIVATPGENGLGTLSQGVLERSNVEVVDEMVSMIVAQRAYEINAKAIQTAEEMMSQTNNLKR
jgi:flagellar basal-body rod protein FlgG